MDYMSYVLESFGGAKVLVFIAIGVFLLIKFGPRPGWRDRLVHNFRMARARRARRREFLKKYYWWKPRAKRDSVSHLWENFCRAINRPALRLRIRVVN